MEWIKECFDYYKDRPFIKEDGKFDMRPVPLLINSKVDKYKLSVFSFNYFSPKDYNIGKIQLSENTYCIHHFDGKWITPGLLQKIKKAIHKTIYCFLGRKGHNSLIKAIRPFIGH